MRKLHFALLGALLAGGQAFAAQDTADVTATIVVPITITKSQDLKFGKVSAVGAGTVVIANNGARSAVGGPVLVSTGSVQNQAIFDVGGEANATYAITLPANATISDGGGHNMTVDTFTSNPNGTGTIGGGGTQAVNVGATLHVGAAQEPGAYTGTFDVTVEYN